MGKILQITITITITTITTINNNNNNKKFWNQIKDSESCALRQEFRSLRIERDEIKTGRSIVQKAFGSFESHCRHSTPITVIIDFWIAEYG
jgi:hypothetical protein